MGRRGVPPGAPFELRRCRTRVRCPSISNSAFAREFAFEGIMEVEHQLFVEEHGHPRGYAIHFHDRISGSVFVLRFGG